MSQGLRCLGLNDSEPAGVAVRNSQGGQRISIGIIRYAWTRPVLTQRTPSRWHVTKCPLVPAAHPLDDAVSFVWLAVKPVFAVWDRSSPKRVRPACYTALASFGRRHDEAPYLTRSE